MASEENLTGPGLVPRDVEEVDEADEDGADEDVADGGVADVDDLILVVVVSEGLLT